MAHELLDCADVVAALEEMRREAVAQCVRADGFCDSGAPRGLANRALDGVADDNLRIGEVDVL